jgi:soluble lytic murein transglycosylase-like protein
MRIVPFIALLGSLCAAPAFAGSVVQFEDGRSMVVENVVEQGEATVHLQLEGGGTISMPASRILSWTPLPSVADERDAVLLVDPVTEPAWRATAGEFAELIADASARYDLDPVLLTAVAEVESAFNPEAVSPKGARGLLQLMPQTAARFGVADPFDAAQNVDAGARYLSWLLKRFDGETSLALAGYNAGEGAVDRHHGIPPYRETERYVVKVLDRADRLSGPAP